MKMTVEEFLRSPEVTELYRNEFMPPNPRGIPKQELMDALRGEPGRRGRVLGGVYDALVRVDPSTTEGRLAHLQPYINDDNTPERLMKYREHMRPELYQVLRDYYALINRGADAEAVKTLRRQMAKNNLIDGNGELTPEGRDYMNALRGSGVIAPPMPRAPAREPLPPPVMGFEPLF